MRPEDFKVLTLHTRFSEVVYQAMEAESERLGMKMSEFVRYAVITYFEHPVTKEVVSVGVTKEPVSDSVVVTIPEVSR